MRRLDTNKKSAYRGKNRRKSNNVDEKELKKDKKRNIIETVSIKNIFKGVQKMDMRKKCKKVLNLIKKVNFLKYVIPILGIIAANIGVYEFVKMAGKWNVKIVILDLILNSVVVYLCLKIRTQEKQIEKNKEEIQGLKDKNDCLMEINDSIRSFRHDFNNIIQAIDGYIILNDMPALKKYFSKLLKECNYVKNLEILTAQASGSPAIYGVLLNKCRLAEKKDIDMNIDILMDFNKVADKAYCLSRIIGILLDNAIEASSECENKNINVQFMQFGNDPVKRIIIENTYNDKSFDPSMIFHKDYTTKKGNSGLGLWKVKEMIDKESEMLLQTTTNANMFKQEIEILV